MSVHRLLVTHPDTPCDAVRRLAVQVSRPSRATLALRYALEGELARLRIPPEGASRRADKLWEHTCFETFVAAEGVPGYVELNFAPSTEWAAYRFAAYRSGMTTLALPAPRIAVDIQPERLTLDVDLDLAPLPALRAVGELRLGISAVIEEADGRLSYWALRHPPGKPDFHHADGFACALGSGVSA